MGTLETAVKSLARKMSEMGEEENSEWVRKRWNDNPSFFLISKVFDK